MSVTVRKIIEDDLELIMKWRMQKDVTRFMNTDPKLTIDGQRIWYQNMITNSDVKYWMILVNNEPAGVLNLTNLRKEDGNIGWAYYIGEKRLRSFETAICIECNMYDYTLLELNKKAVWSDVFSKNKGVIALHQMCGAEIVEEKKAFVNKNGIDFDVTFMKMTKANWLLQRKNLDYEKIDLSGELNE